MVNVLIITPAFQRYDLTRITLEYNVEQAERLAARSINIDTIVISDDDNLDTATDLGHITKRARNWLGERFNHGYEYAVKKNYDFAVPLGSDCILSDEVLVALDDWPRDVIFSTRWFTAIENGGQTALQFMHPIWLVKGFPHSALVNNPRPCKELIMRRCDSMTHRGVMAANPDLTMETFIHGPLETIQFTTDVQVTPYEKMAQVSRRAGYAPIPAPWEELEALYGETITKVRALYPPMVEL